MPKLDLLTAVQRRRLKVLRLVAALSAIVVAAGVVAVALYVHWALVVPALFFSPVAVYLLVVLFETIVPE